MSHYEYEINLYLDKELPLEMEAELFLHLSQCQQCRVEFRKCQQVKEGSKYYFKNKYEESGVIVTKQFNPYKYFTYFSAAAALVLIFLQVFNPAISLFDQRIGHGQAISQIPNNKKEGAGNYQSTVRNNYKFYTEEEYLREIKKLRTVSVEIEKQF